MLPCGRRSQPIPASFSRHPSNGSLGYREASFQLLGTLFTLMIGPYIHRGRMVVKLHEIVPLFVHSLSQFLWLPVIPADRTCRTSLELGREWFKEALQWT